MKELMTFKVVPYDSKTVEIQKFKVDTFRREDVVMVKVPKDIDHKEMPEFIHELKLIFHAESLVIVGHDVEFAKLVNVDE